jgi:hypothetical protein
MGGSACISDPSLTMAKLVSMAHFQGLETDAYSNWIAFGPLAKARGRTLLFQVGSRTSAIS